MGARLQFPGSLHNHTDFSNLRLRDCIIKTEELIDSQSNSDMKSLPLQIMTLSLTQ